MVHIDTLFKTMLEEGASDLHLVAGQKPTLRIHGELERLENHDVLDHDALLGSSTGLHQLVIRRSLRRPAMWILGMNSQAWRAFLPRLPEGDVRFGLTNKW